MQGNALEDSLSMTSFSRRLLTSVESFFESLSALVPYAPRHTSMRVRACGVCEHDKPLSLIRDVVTVFAPASATASTTCTPVLICGDVVHIVFSSLAV